MYDFTKLTENEKDTIVSSLRLTMRSTQVKLKSPHLGDIERIRTQEYGDDVKRIMKKVVVQFG